MAAAMESLPVIDIAPLYENNKDALMKVAHAIDDACRTWGFFYITGHGIPESRMKELERMAKTFFSLPMAEKKNIDVTATRHHRGYGDYGAEQLDREHSIDFKEVFDMGYDLPEDHPEVKAGRPFRGPNNHPDIPGWRDLLETHYKDMMRVAQQVFRALALALNIAEDFFVEKFQESLSSFRMIHYPALPEEKGRVVCGEHTDYGIVTLLYQGFAGGLQVRNLKGEWMPAPPVPGSFVVNIGDMMAMWSNGRYKSTPHRVLNPGVDRISMPFFTEPNPKTIIECLPNCCDEANPARFPAVSCSDWLQRRFKETYAYRQSAES